MTTIPMSYQTAYEWQGEAAQGDVSIEGHPELAVGSPHDGDRYSPEHLLVATAETCLANYVLLIADMSKLTIRAYRSSAEGELEKDQGGYRFKRILIRPEVEVEASAESLARRVVDKAHRACLIARSLSFPVEIEPTFRT